jgi:hypothetical protein
MNAMAEAIGEKIRAIPTEMVTNFIVSLLRKQFIHLNWLAAAKSLYQQDDGRGYQS